MMDEVDQDEVVRTLFGWFGYKQLQLADLTDAQVTMVADLYGIRAARRGRRRLLVLILGKMDGYRCATETNLGDTLAIVRPSEGSREAIYQIQRSR